MKRWAVVSLAALLLGRAAVCQSDLRILVRGQEMVFDTLTIQDGLPYITSSDKSLAQVSALLGGSTAPVLPSGAIRISLRDLAKLYHARVTIDPDRNIWYLDPYVNGVSVKTNEDKTEARIESTTPIQPTLTRLEDPPRIVVDFPYAVLSENVSLPSAITGGLVEWVEMAQFQAKPNIVRVVLHLRQSTVEWATQVDPETKELSVVVSPMMIPAFQETGTPGKAGQHSPAFLGGIELKTITAGNEEKLAADLKFSAPTAYAWRKLRSPDNRVYIDFLNCLRGMGKSIEFDNPYFEVIRVAQFQKTPVPIVRVALQLRKPYHVEVQNAAEGLRVSVSFRVEDAGEVLAGGGMTGYSLSLALGHGRFNPRGPMHPNGIVVALDPGHGGSDPGARGRTLVEKEVTLDIAERLRGKLEEEGFTVVMTRTGDEDVLGYHGSAKAELQARVDVAARVGAMMFLSLHINSSDYSWPHGIQSHWYKSMDLPLATLIQARLRDVPGFVDRGVMRDRFYVLHHTAVPAALIEMGFLSNRGDEAQLADAAVRDRLAEAISRGIVEYAGVNVKGDRRGREVTRGDKR